MNPRTTLVLLAIAAALGAFVYFYEIRGEPARLEAEEAAKRLFQDVAEEEIREIAFTTSGGTFVRVARAEQESWRLVEPVDFPADAFTVDGMASLLAELQAEREYEEPQPPEVYGLAEGARVVRFQADGTEHELRFGDTAPVGSSTYAATDASQSVYLIPSYRVNTFRRALDDLRDKRVLRFDPDSIARIHASWPDGEVVLERVDGRTGDDAARAAADTAAEEAAGELGEGDGGRAPSEWRMVEPLAYRADETSIEQLLDGLERLRANAFIDEPESDESLGLEPPAFEATLETRPGAEGEPTRFHVAIGEVRPEGDRVARGREGLLYAVGSEAVAGLPRRSVSAYQWKQLASFEQSEAQRFEIALRDAGQEAGEEPLVVTGEYGDTGWTTRPHELKPGMPFAIVSELRELRAAEILAESMDASELESLGLSPPRVALRVYGDAPEEGGDAPLLAEVHLGAFDPEGAPAKVPTRDTVYRLAASTAELVPVSLEAYRNRFVAEDGEDEPGEAAGDAAEAGEDAAEASEDAAEAGEDAAEAGASPY